MQIHTLSQDTALWQSIASMQLATTQARAEGLHLSTIVNDIAATLYPSEFGYLKAQASGEGVIDDNTRAMFEVGHVIEEAMARVMAERAGWERPKPIQHDGIWCSPDGYQHSTRTIDEMKVTWKSARDFIQSMKWQRYMWQVLAYIHVWGATRARIHVLHVNGDYRPPRPIPPATYIVRPTSAEIRENWRLITQHAKDRGWLQNQRAR